MRDAPLIALFERDRFAYHQWLYARVEEQAVRAFGKKRLEKARVVAAQEAKRLVQEERILERFLTEAPGVDFSDFVMGLVRPRVEQAFLLCCQQDENLLVMRTQEMARQEVLRLYKNRRAVPGSADEDLLHETTQYVLMRLAWGRKVLEAFTGERGMNFTSYLRTCVRHAAIDRVRTQVGRSTLWDEHKSLEQLSDDTDSNWENWLVPSREEAPAVTALEALLHVEEEGRIASVWATLAQLAREDDNVERMKVVEAWLARGLEMGDLPSIQDLAEELGMPRGTVSSHLFRFRKRVARFLPGGLGGGTGPPGPPSPDG